MAEINPNSKQQRAIKIVLSGKSANPPKSRKVLIQEIREQCGMSDAGAATYYQNAVTSLRNKGLIKKVVVTTVDEVVSTKPTMDMSVLANSGRDLEVTGTEEVTEEGTNE